MDWYLAVALPAEYGNMRPGGSPMGIGVDTLGYLLLPLATAAEGVEIVPNVGTSYLAAGPPFAGADTIRAAEPLQEIYSEHVTQLVVRGGEDYLGYLRELMGTPFLMTPRRTPGGHHQTDSRLGSDCAAFAVYGRRRMGRPVEYLGPGGIIRYLRLLRPGSLAVGGDSGKDLYLDRLGKPVPIGEEGLLPGDILHFGEQVSVFAEDRGLEGFLDGEDMLIQSWRNGPHLCTVENSGFAHLPVRIYRWAEGF